MCVFLVSDALLITLSRCIRGENTSWHLNVHIVYDGTYCFHLFWHNYVKLESFSLFCVSIFWHIGCIWRWGAPRNSHHAQPCRLVLPGPQAVRHSPFHKLSCATYMYHFILFTDSNNSGDNLYTMINTGPGNRNNVSSGSSFSSALRVDFERRSAISTLKKWTEDNN